MNRELSLRLRFVGFLLFLFRIHCLYAQLSCSTEGELLLDDGVIADGIVKGNLLVCDDGQTFSGVCSAGFNLPEIRAACRQLGYVDGAEAGESNANNMTISDQRFRCTGAVSALTDGSCEISTVPCSNNRIQQVACTDRFLSLFPLIFPNSQSFDGSSNPLTIQFIQLLPVGLDVYNNAIVHPAGFMQFGDTLLNPDTQINNQSLASVIYPFRPDTLTSIVSLSARVSDDISSPHMEIVTRFVNSNIAVGFTPEMMILVEWKYDQENIRFQSVVVTDYNDTYVVYIYQCSSLEGLGIIGYSLKNGKQEMFRYSDTPFASQIGCINNVQDNIQIYNLYYHLTDNVSPPIPGMHQNGSCVDFITSDCCRPFDDPTTSCSSGSGSGTCYCDALCFERNDCCNDIELIVNNIQPCIRLCTEGTVGLAGNTIYPTGPVGVCDNGYMRFISEEGTFVQRIINENTTCFQMYTQAGGNFDDFSNSTIDRTVYPVYREDVVCSGIEERVQDCPFAEDVETTMDSSNLLTVNCLGVPPPVCTNGNITLTQSDLIEGNFPSQGIVEICLFGQWKRVCVPSVSDDVVMHLCGFLDFGIPDPTSALLEDSVLYGINSIECASTDNSISDCIINYDSCEDLLILVLSCDINQVLNINVDTITTATFFTAAVIGGLSAAASGVIVLIIMLVVVMVVYMKFRAKYTVRVRATLAKGEEEIHLDDTRYVSKFPFNGKLDAESLGSVQILDDFSADKLIIPNSQLRLLDCVGQGEFGLVYKAHYLRGGNADYVAVKTLKGVFDKNEIDDMLKESLLMKKLDHLNVMQLLGVSIDTGSSPYIVLPFMSGGSLLHYLKKYRSDLLEKGEPSTDAEENEIKLLSMCLQVAKGMEYIAGKCLVHRDLAARNCMIDHEGTIKVSDFGLSTSLYEKMYFRQEKTDSVKLPIKWMAIESIEDGIFSEKSDVWSFGVTCWEVFSGGKTPFGGIIPYSIPKLLLESHRLERPYNTACSIRTYEAIMLQCWKESPDDRPSFSNLVGKIDETLTAMAGYMDFNTFNLNVIATNDQSKTPLDTEDEAEPHDED